MLSRRRDFPLTVFCDCKVSNIFTYLKIETVKKWKILDKCAQQMLTHALMHKFCACFYLILEYQNNPQQHMKSRIVPKFSRFFSGTSRTFCDCWKKKKSLRRKVLLLNNFPLKFKSLVAKILTKLNKPLKTASALLKYRISYN